MLTLKQAKEARAKREAEHGKQTPRVVQRDNKVFSLAINNVKKPKSDRTKNWVKSSHKFTKEEINKFLGDNSSSIRS